MSKTTKETQVLLDDNNLAKASILLCELVINFEKSSLSRIGIELIFKIRKFQYNQF